MHVSNGGVLAQRFAVVLGEWTHRLLQLPLPMCGVFCDVVLRGSNEEDVQVEIGVLPESMASRKRKVADLPVHAPVITLILQAVVDNELCSFALAGNADVPCEGTFAGCLEALHGEEAVWEDAGLLLLSQNGWARKQTHLYMS